MICRSGLYSHPIKQAVKLRFNKKFINLLRDCREDIILMPSPAILGMSSCFSIAMLSIIILKLY